MFEVSEIKDDERRAAPRKRAFKKAMISFNARFCSAECLLKNENNGGALLKVEQNHVIPAQFEIKIHPEREFRLAEAIWRTPNEMGIRFLDARGNPLSSAPVQRKSQNAWDGVERRKNDRREGERRG